MPRTWSPYPRTLRDRIIKLARNGPPKDLAEEFDPTQMMIRNWLMQADRDDGKRAELSIDERDKLRRLRKKKRQMKQVRDILAKATDWFARDTSAGV